MFSISRRSRTAIFVATLWLVAAWVDANDKIEYNRDIRPILTDACFKCHGPAARKGGFRLDLREEAVKPTKSGTSPIIAGKPEQSELIRRIFTTAEDEVMPPRSSPRILKAAEKELLKKWIVQGAVYQKHWSFEPPVKAELPKVDGTRYQNPIDIFLAARLRREGLSMSPQADRTTLIRRVAFALTGLPPTPAEVDEFLRDSRAAKPQAEDLAYEKMVDRYLASNRYGEEMARHWLDVARYADTHGLHLDNERQMWLYRDWVIKAFNDNLAFDRFTVEQLAGDLLPNPTNEQLIATGFQRCNVTTGEGGSIDSEWVFRNALDRTNTMTETWLGLTAGCAVCHDHKFDPISAKEYYSLYAFFYSADGPALDGNALLTAPIVKKSMPAAEKKLAELTQQIAKVVQERTAKLKTLAYVDPAEIVPAEMEPSKTADDAAHSFKAWRNQKKHDIKNLPKDIGALLKQTKRDEAGEQKLRDYYLQNICAAIKPGFDALNQQLAALTKERTGVDQSIPGTFVFKELERPRDSFVMMRGQYDKPGDKVEPNTPSALPPLVKAKPGGRANRLDLARWLVAPEHPLTARVAVNRIWQQLFGTGLVKTSADFGAQGEPPSHPELLDYLAVRFREQGWDVKALVRLMVTSAAFRQSSSATPELLKRDPENRLYARGPRFRLDAEQIRDNALFVSGLINLEMGGRGVRPYQPPKIWEPVAFTGSNTGTYTQDKGAALYRRSIYTFLKRTAPPPYLANFDAPNRESMCSGRERSNTPLQALQLMNDVQHFEAARKLAERILVEGGKSPAERIRFAYRLLLAREPESLEIGIVQKTLEQHLDRFHKDEEAAKKTIRVGESPLRPGLAEPELAAYTLIANLLLNLDETVTRN
jgi:hypothetical protein